MFYGSKDIFATHHDLVDVEGQVEPFVFSLLESDIESEDEFSKLTKSLGKRYAIKVSRIGNHGG